MGCQTQMNLFTELRIFHSQLTKNHPVIKEGVRWSERPVKLMAFETPLECSHWIRIYLSRATSIYKASENVKEFPTIEAFTLCWSIIKLPVTEACLKIIFFLLF